MRRSATTLGALLLIAVAISAPLVLATHGTFEVASQHSTATEFGAQSLTNLSVVGSGSAASVQFGNQTTTATREPDDSSATKTELRGVRIQPQTDLFGVTGNISANTGTVTNIEIYNVSSGARVAQKSVTLTAGDSFTIQADLNASTTYNLVANDSGASYTPGFDGDATFPYTSPDIDIVNGAKFQTTSANDPSIFRQVTALTGGNATGGKYVATHSVTDAEDARLNISTLDNVSVNLTVRTAGGTVLNNTQVTTTGIQTFTLAATSATDLETVLNISSTGSASRLELDSEAILFDSAAPSASNTAPPDGTEVAASDVTLSTDVNDTDFGTAQGDTVTAVFSIDGTQVATRTTSSNGTVSATETVSGGGQHNYTIELTDSYGNTVTTATNNFTLPRNVTLRRESEPHERIDSATVTIGVFGSNETLDKRTVTDGNISLVGLPVNETYVITVNETDSPLRSAIVRDVFDQSSIFVPNETERSLLQTQFAIDDRTGEFADATLIVQKAINRSLYDPTARTDYQWTDVAGDRLGAGLDLIVNLIQDDRYRLVVRNAEGDTRILGEYPAKEPRSVQLVIESAGITQERSRGDVVYAAQQTGNSPGDEIEIRYNDTRRQTSELRIIIYELTNRTNELVNTTIGGTLGEAAYTEVFGTQAEANTSWVVELRADRSGDDVQVRLPLGAGQQPLLPRIPAPFPAIGGMAIVLVTPALLGGERAETGAVVATLLAGTMWWIDVMPDEVGISAIVLAMVVAVFFKIRSREPGEVV